MSDGGDKLQISAIADINVDSNLSVIYVLKNARTGDDTLLVAQDSASIFTIKRKADQVDLVLYLSEHENVFVKDRMLYASGIGALKELIDTIDGVTLNQDLRVETFEELSESPDVPVEHKSKEITLENDITAAMSTDEIERMRIIEEQESERMEQITKAKAALASESDSQTSDGNESLISSHVGKKDTVAAKSGGFHAINLPLSSTASSALSSFLGSQSQSALCLDRVTELALNETLDCVDLLVTKSFRTNTAENLQHQLPVSLEEPRFLLYTMHEPFKRAMVYYSPGTVAAKHRMIYTSARAGLLQEIRKITAHDPSLAIDCTLEIYEKSELTPLHIRRELLGRSQMPDQLKVVCGETESSDRSPAPTVTKMLCGPPRRKSANNALRGLAQLGDIMTKQSSPGNSSSSKRVTSFFSPRNSVTSIPE